jgi:hypothetical protein
MPAPPRKMPPLRPSNDMPGGSAALPEGELSKPFFGPQGDENREPPPNSPVPPQLGIRVTDEEAKVLNDAKYKKA